MRLFKSLSLTRLFAILLLSRFVVLAIRAFLPVGLPEVWRQTDTLAVALRYWNRWALEPTPSFRWLPAVLNSGDTAGIMPMEFPVLNILTAPGFFFGPYVGKIVAMEILFLSALGLTLANARAWRGSKVAGVPAGTAMLLLPLLSLGAEWAGKFMPDFVSMSLVTLAIGLSWKGTHRTFAFCLRP